MYPATARAMGFTKWRGEHEGFDALFLSTYISQAAHVSLTQGNLSKAVCAYEWMVVVAGHVGRKSLQSHTVLCDALSSVVQAGVTRLDGGFADPKDDAGAELLDKGIAACRRLLEESTWKKTDEQRVHDEIRDKLGLRAEDLEEAEDYLDKEEAGKSNNDDSDDREAAEKKAAAVAEKARKAKLCLKLKIQVDAKRRSDPNRYNSTQVRLAHDQLARMLLAKGDGAGAQASMRAAVELAVDEAREAAAVIRRQERASQREVKAVEASTAKAVEAGEMTAEDAEKKLARQRKAAAASSQRLQRNKRVSAGLVSLQTIKGVVHATALGGGDKGAEARSVADFVRFGIAQHVELSPESAEEEDEAKGEGEARADSAAEKEEDAKQVDVQGEKTDAAVLDIGDVSKAQKTGSGGPAAAAALIKAKPQAKVGAAELERLRFALAYVLQRGGGLGETAERASWDAAAHSARAAGDALADTSPAINLIRVAVDCGSRYLAAGKLVQSFRYSKVAFEVAAHALRENEQKELWVYVLKDLVRTICATQAERLVAAGYERGMIPKICDVLTANKITTPATLKALRLKEGATEALFRGNGGESETGVEDEEAEEVELG